MVIKEASTGETLSPRKMSTFRLNSKRWKDTVQPPQFLAVQPQVWGTPHISSLSKGLSFHLQSLLTFYHKHSSPFYTRNDPLLLLHLFSFFWKLEKMRLDFVFQDFSFQLDVAPLNVFKHLRTLDLNFYDNHRFFCKLGLKFIYDNKNWKKGRSSMMIMYQESPTGEDLESLWEANQDVDLQCLCRLSLHCWLSQHNRQVRVHLKNDWCAQG